MPDDKPAVRDEMKVRRYGFLTVLWIALFFILGLATAGFYPPVNYNMGDEIWAWSGSLDFVQGSYKVSSVTPRLYFLLLGHFLSLTGGGIYAARVFSLLAACGVLYLACLLGKEMEDVQAGFLASVILGATFAFSWHSRVARPEMMSAALVVAAFYMLYKAKGGGRSALLFLGSFTAALSIHVHPNNLQYVLGLVPVYLVLFAKRSFKWRPMLSFMGGIAAGFLVWLVVVYSPASVASAPLESSAKAVTTVTPFPVLNKNPLKLFWESLLSLPKDYVQYVRLFDLYFPNRISMALPASLWAGLCAFAMFTGHRRKVLLPVLFVLATSFVNYFIAEKFGYWHFVEFFPLLAVSAALALHGLMKKIKGAKGMALAYALAGILVVVGIADTAMGIYSFRGYNYERLLGKVAAAVDGRVLGMDLYSPAFSKDTFVHSWFNIDTPGRSCPPVGQKIRELGVKYIIADEVLQKFARLSCGIAYERELSRYVFTACTPVGVVDERYPSYWASDGMISEIYIVKTPD